jgi:flavin reductase (DIM6/NTAB) family NADH-FMN oxidoreductase RutF
MEELYQMDKDAFKNAASKFPTGVVVAITNHDNTWHGMTISSFTTISMDPLIVMISISKKAKMHDILMNPKNSKFSISILTENQKELSNQFAGKKSEIIDKNINKYISNPEDGYTVLNGSMSYFLCDLDEAYNKGDHTLFFGKVNKSWSSNDNRKPLVYYSRSYPQLIINED